MEGADHSNAQSPGIVAQARPAPAPCAEQRLRNFRRVGETTFSGHQSANQAEPFTEPDNARHREHDEDRRAGIEVFLPDHAKTPDRHGERILAS